jgi:hypothetical protein
VSFVDGGDFVEGHGTHVSASISGILEDNWKVGGGGGGGGC